MNSVFSLWGSTVAQWLALLPHSKKVLGSSPDLSVWSWHVLPVFAWVSSHIKTSKDMHSILLSLPRDQGTGIRTGVGPRALHCGCPLFLTSLGWVKCRGRISPPGLIKYDLFIYFIYLFIKTLKIFHKIICNILKNQQEKHSM